MLRNSDYVCFLVCPNFSVTRGLNRLADCEETKINDRSEATQVILDAGIILKDLCLCERTRFILLGKQQDSTSQLPLREFYLSERIRP